MPIKQRTPGLCVLLGQLNHLAITEIQNPTNDLFTLPFENPIRNPFADAQKYIEIQYAKFKEFNLEQFSLKQQIIHFLEFIEKDRPKGIIFIDYDGTIIQSKIMSAYTTDQFYHTSKVQWQNSLRLLQSKGFLTCLCTNRIPILGEDDLFNAIIDIDLKNLFETKLFVSRILPKGLLMHYLSVLTGEPIIPMILIDNDWEQLATAELLKFQCVPLARRTVQFTLPKQMPFFGGKQISLNADYLKSKFSTVESTLPPLIDWLAAAPPELDPKDSWVHTAIKSLKAVGPARMAKTSVSPPFTAFSSMASTESDVVLVEPLEVCFPHTPTYAKPIDVTSVSPFSKKKL